MCKLLTFWAWFCVCYWLFVILRSMRQAFYLCLADSRFDLLWSNCECDSSRGDHVWTQTSQTNNMAQPKANKCHSSTSHLSPFNCCLSVVVFCSLKKGDFPQICMLCFARICSAIFNLLCVWIPNDRTRPSHLTV